MAVHALLSASAAERWMACPGSLALSRGLPDSSSRYAAEGTVMHEVASWALVAEHDAAAYIGRVVEVDGEAYEFDADMAAIVQVYLDTVREYRGSNGTMFVEQRVDYSDTLGVPDSFGTADCLLVVGNTLIVIDLKTGHNPVEAENNKQMQLYALGALPLVEMVVDIERVVLVISQPKVRKAPSEWDLSVAELGVFADEAAAVAKVAHELATTDDCNLDGHLNPTADGCRYCKAKATCPALRAAVADTIGTSAASPEEFGVLEVEPSAAAAGGDEVWLAAALSKVDMIEDWCAAVRKEAERRLHAGECVPGFKLVEGRRGQRKWTDEAEVIATLKGFRLKQDEMFEMSVISPAKAEKLLKETPKRWTKVQTLITQAEGKPTVAPESDKRPALVVTPVADDFTEVAADLI